MIAFIAWTLITLATVTAAIAAARRYGIEIAAAIYASLTVIANVIAFKRVMIGQLDGLALIAPAGVIVYSSTFLITDFVSEIAGKEEAKKTVIAGIIANAAAILSIYVAVIWQPAPIMSDEEVRAFSVVFSFAPRIVVASIIAFVVSQLHDVYAFHFWKKFTRGKHLWLRNNASTAASQAIDTVIFISVAFYGVVPNAALLAMMMGQYVVKLAIAALDTPFIYAATSLWRVPEIKKSEA